MNLRDEFKRLAVVAAMALAACGGPDAGLMSDDVDGDEWVQGEDELTTASHRVSVWFPQAKGNVWVFESGSATRTLRLNNVTPGMATLEGLYPSALWLGTNDETATTLQGWDETTSNWLPWMRFGFVSTSWNYGTAACTGSVMKRTATGAVVASKAGTFSDTRTISVTQVTKPNVRCAAPAITELTFAANVGLVAFRTGKGERFTLRSATVGGKTIPGSVSAALTFDKSSYTSKPNTIRCITTPCPSNAQTAVAKAKFTVTNSTSSSVTWRFNTGCQFDLDLVTSGGTVVKRLSTERACTEALTQLTLAAGASKVYTFDVPLHDRDLLQLDGSYTARARLIATNTSPTSPTATTTLSVRVQ
ncbi:MAG: hypothetical protein JNG84_11010 [Archangium sp.]|nr:hypothetical protein [Archangium sp.]